MTNKNRGFSLIELLVVIIIIAIISIVAFISFGNKGPEARDAIRTDTAGKVTTAFALKITQEAYNYQVCSSEMTELSISGSTICSIELNGNDNSKLFLQKLGVSGVVKDPTTTNPNYVFSYIKGEPTYQFAYTRETAEKTAFNFIESVFAQNYSEYQLGFTRFAGNYRANQKPGLYTIIPIQVLDAKASDGSLIPGGMNSLSGSLSNSGVLTYFETKNKIVSSETPTSNSNTGSDSNTGANQSSSCVAGSINSSLKPGTSIVYGGLIQNQTIAITSNLGDINTETTLTKTITSNLKCQDTVVSIVTETENDVVCKNGYVKSNGNVCVSAPFYTYNFAPNLKFNSLAGDTILTSRSWQHIRTYVLTPTEIYYTSNPYDANVDRAIWIANKNTMGDNTTHIQLPIYGHVILVKGDNIFYVKNSGYFYKYNKSTQVETQITNSFPSYSENYLLAEGDYIYHRIDGAPYFYVLNTITNEHIVDNSAKTDNPTNIYDKVDGTFTYKNDGNGNIKLYDSANPKYTFTDAVQTPLEVTTDSVNTGAYIKIDSTLPSGTSYKVKIRNNLSQVNYFTADELTSLLLKSGYFSITSTKTYKSGKTGAQIASSLSVGTEFYMFNNGTQVYDKFKVISKSGTNPIRVNLQLWDGYQWGAFYFGDYTWMGDDYPAYSESYNYTSDLDITQFDGLHYMDFTQAPFNWTPSMKLYFKLELVGDATDNSKTPIIKSIELSK